jgi:tetratricopeptide (TPR) repeat protein
MGSKFGGNGPWGDKLGSYIVLIACVVLCLSGAILLHSRAFTIGYAFSACFIFFAYKGFAVKPAYILATVTGLIVLLNLLIFAFKSDSSAGRMLIYKISWYIFREHYGNGIGFGKFQQEYGLFQAAYFKRGAYSPKELLLADNTYYAFNDYWQFIIELGIKGVILVIAAVIGVGRLVWLSLKKNSSYPAFLLLVITQIIAISIAGFFTHIFEKVYVQFVFILLVFLLLNYVYGRQGKIRYFIFCVGAFSCIGLSYNLLDLYILKHAQYQQWIDAKELQRAGYLNQSLRQYQRLYPDMLEYPAFLEDYVSVLIPAGQYGRANSILLQLMAHRTKNAYYSDLGMCYDQLHLLKEAESAYQTAVFIVPNRFVSRYSLYTFYRDNGQIAKARTCADQILGLPVKIHSAQITFILNRIKQEDALLDKAELCSKPH